MASPILQTWVANAARWNQLLQQGGLQSRILATNQALVDRILAAQPQRLLDVGCGEGWLCRALAPYHIATWGVDGVPELVAAAQGKHKGQYSVASYEQLAAGYPVFHGMFDMLVFNFCLYEHELTERLLQQASNWVRPGGRLLIQTLHEEVLANADGTPPEAGYQTEQWAGLDGFTGSYQWYFRRQADWEQCLHNAGWQLLYTHTTRHPHTGQQLSWLFEAGLQA